MDKVTLENQENFLSDAVAIVEKGRQTAYASVNQAMVATYWQLGRHIVENEQGGAERAEYGKKMITSLAHTLTGIYGKSYNARNLYYFCQFYQLFPREEILNARVQNLTWTHFRHLLRVDNKGARDWYMNEAAQEQWSVRTLDRNISSQYYERLLLSQRKEPVKQGKEIFRLEKGGDRDV